MTAKTKLSQPTSIPNYGQLTNEIIEFWKDNKIFEKSIENRSKDNPYFFYDGPPFVTGLPHYGHLLGGIAKDLVPRYWTMKGKRVERVWGWDCHGLPVENKVETKLKLNSRRDIEKVGLDTFIKECANYVSEISDEWDWYVDHSGRWVDLKNAYKTMDDDYMESVWWVFKQIYDKDLIYKGKRVSLYCPRCGTPISNFEVAMDNSYKDVTEPSNIYKYKVDLKHIIGEKNKTKNTKIFDKLKEDDKVYLLAWSTTPWNKLATPALAVNSKLAYVLVKEANEYYILAKTTLKVLKSEYKIISEFSGRDLKGLHFIPHYDFYNIPDDKQTWVVVNDDFVTAEEGTGIVTIAVYGEDDFRVMKEQNIAIIEHVDGEGHVRLNLNLKGKHGDPSKFDGAYYLKANKLVNQDLTERGLMYDEQTLTHSVAECWRCKTRLMHAPQDAWFLAINKLKKQLLKTNENIYWFPEHLKHGRFQKGIESAPDWCISRSRYWATPMPVWQCDNPNCQHRVVIGSKAELEKLTGKKVTDMHRPYIDKHTFMCKCGGTMHRIPDVLDSWMDAGSMPYAQHHYPFENKKKVEKSFPADYIVEYVAQTRAWFYVLHVISNALWGTHSFKNVICTGVIQGTDGRKMSKSYGNYPDPRKVLEAYGGDALRLYLMSSPIMSAENLNINEKEIEEQNKRTLSILWNSYKYFVTYANLHQYQIKHQELNLNKMVNPLDKWVVVKLREFEAEMSHFLEKYNIPKAVRKLRPFITDLSTWYIRRSRDRFVNGDTQALNTMYYVLYELTKLMAPVVPFMAEKIYQNLKLDSDPQSVHLCDWPIYPKLNDIDYQLLIDMQTTREICNSGNAQRKLIDVPTRQPLATATVTGIKEELDDNLVKIIKAELNVKQVIFYFNNSKINEIRVELDTKITPELKAEGEARRIVRQIQALRKKAGVDLQELITVSLPDWPETFTQEIKQKTMLKDIVKGEKMEIIG